MVSVLQSAGLCRLTASDWPKVGPQRLARKGWISFTLGWSSHAVNFLVEKSRRCLSLPSLSLTFILLCETRVWEGNYNIAQTVHIIKLVSCNVYLFIVLLYISCSPGRVPRLGLEGGLGLRAQRQRGQIRIMCERERERQMEGQRKQGSDRRTISIAISDFLPKKRTRQSAVLVRSISLERPPTA